MQIQKGQPLAVSEEALAAAQKAVKGTGVWLALDPSSCPVCKFSTRINGRLQHEQLCPLRGQGDAGRGVKVVTDAMRQAAWMVHPSADVPYTEIYWAMLTVAPKQ